jgi:RNA-directed DNA polymerase
MMHGREKSDSAILAVKPPNGAGVPAEEGVERRAEAEGNAGQDRTHRAQDRESVSQGLERVRHVARTRKKERFTALLHHVSPELLRMAFFALKRQAAPGVDGMTWQTYEADLDRRIEDLHQRVHRGAYRAHPARRGFIPKADGSRRPLAIAALEDKIVQRATAAVLNAIYEEDFLGFSYGFRPGRGAHDALDALAVGITSTKVNWILDADIRSFFELACWYPPQQAGLGSKLRRSSLPARSFRNALSVRGTSGNKYSPVWASGAMAIVPL